MRVVVTLSDQKKSKQLSAFLASEGIENQLEIQTVTDWGSANYGDLICKIWIYEEDQVLPAKRWIEKFEENPEDPLFKPYLPLATTIHTKIEEHLQRTPPSGFKEEKIKPPPRPLKKELPDARKLGSFTLALLVLCTLLFIMIESTAPPIPKSYPEYLPAAAIFSPPIKKALFYDYPQNFVLADQLVKLYGLEGLQTPKNLPVEGQLLLKKFLNTPFWQGIYPLIVASAQQKMGQQAAFENNAPLFEKIREGEFWRLFTPCLMHNDILHLLFNMIWLILLGKQLEERLGGVKYLSLILVTGILTNTCQYLMSGANFIGISGVLCAMLTFIWTRQRIAPWEGYPLQKATIAFLLIFILGMFSLQLFSFYQEVSGQSALPTGIANTAHLSGAAFGALLGLFPFFSWKT